MASLSFSSRPLSTDGYNYKQLRRLGISNSSALSVLPLVKTRSFSAGTIIWPKGGPVNSWGLIMTGLIAQFSPMESRASIPVRVYGTGSWFGEESLIHQAPSFLGYECLTDIDTLVLPQEAVLGLLEKDIGFNTKFSKLVTGRLQRSSETNALQKYGKPCMKVVLGIAQIIDALTIDNETSETPTQLSIPISQGVLASLCGVARTVFSSHVLQLEQKGWVQISYGKLEILNLELWINFLKKHRLNEHTPMFDSIEDLVLLMKLNKM